MAPELTQRGATLILSHTPPGLPVEAMAEQGFVLATAGFPRARPEDLSELAGLFMRVYASLPAPDGEWMPSYIDRVRKGDVTEPRESAAAGC